MPSTDFSNWKRAQKVIAQGALTNSKHPGSHVFGVYPTHASSGNGSLLFADGKLYVDYICSLGANLLGHNNPRILERLKDNLDKGFSHSLPTTFELDTAEALNQLFYFTSSWKFLKSGSEACNAAIKIARAHQGVKNGNEGLLEMLVGEVCKRFSLQVQKDWKKESGLQNLRENLSIAPTNHGNKAQGAEEICEDGGGKNYGEEILPHKVDEGKNERPGEGLFFGQTGPEAWNIGETFMRNLWEEECPRPSRGLFKTIARKLALSIASRGKTPRYLILSDGYHGIGDSFISLTEPHSGVLNDLSILPLQGNEDLISIAAAVIVEPVITDFSQERRAWLQALRDKCTETGALLIFDEVITGFRFPKYCVSQYFNINPDLIIIGKAMANGMPLAAVGGKAEIMEGDYFVSSTYAGEILSMVACKTVCELISSHRYSLAKLWEDGQRFIDRFNQMSPHVKLEGYPTRGTFRGEPLPKALLFQEAIKAGILLGPSWFFNFGHADHNFFFFSFLKDFVDRLNRNEIKLEGALPRSPFAERVRNAE